jgi:hypothetical protein
VTNDDRKRYDADGRILRETPDLRFVSSCAFAMNGPEPLGVTMSDCAPPIVITSIRS